MAASKWSGQKASASTWIKSALAGGQEKTVDELVDGLKSQGVSNKNALKALYAETTAGTVTMTGTWTDGKFKAKGAG